MRPATVLLPLLLLSGCAGKKLPALDGLKNLVPKVSFQEFKLKKVDFQGAETAFVFEVKNPYPVGLDLASLNWDLGVAGHALLDGSKDSGVDIDPAGTSAVRIPVSVKFTDIFAVAADAKKAGEVPWTIHGDFAFNTPVGPLKLPFKQTGVMPALSAPRIQLKALRVDKLDVLKGKVNMALDIGLESDSEKPLNFKKFGYGIKLAGKEVLVGDAQVPVIEGGKGTLTLPLDLQLVQLGTAVVQSITDKGPLEVGLDADTQVDTPFGVIPFKVNRSQELRIK